jgi:hypothetical protein
MTKLLIVGDGERDGASLPSLVQTILATPIQHEFERWPRLQKKGLDAKLRFAVLQARNRQLKGLVAVVDADQRFRSEKIKKLIGARAEMRQSALAFPTALGEAVPNGDAWLLDDPIAVCDALQLDRSTKIAVVTKVRDPKAELNAIIALSPRAGEEILPVLCAIASLVQGERCFHAADTGFEAFTKDVAAELSPD